MTTTARHDETRRFLDALTLGVPEDSGLHTYLWSLPDKHSHWMPLDDVAGIAAAAQEMSDYEGKRDVYVAVAAAASLPPVPSKRIHTRLNSDTVAGMYGLWADIDIRDANTHKKFNLPADVDEAMEIVNSVGLPPTIVVHSGHGLQVWWCFKEFWQFESDEDRRAAADLARRWNGTLLARAVERSQVVDSTFDLARIMRLPGTYNHKGDVVEKVRLLSCKPAVRYEPEDFAEHTLDDDYLASTGVSSTLTYQMDGGIVLDAKATVDAEWLEEARALDPKFALTWERKRKDFADQSQSTYDMSLAGFGAAWEADDQLIANLIIFHRRLHKEKPEKALRTDYIGRTIGRARESHQREDASERIEDVAEAIAEAQESEVPERIDTARRDVLDVIGEQIGLAVIRVVKYTSDPPTFRLITPSKAIDLGPADGVVKAERFRTTVYGATRHLVPAFARPAWDQIVGLIGQAWVEEDLGGEATTRGETLEWIQAYLRDKPVMDNAVEAYDAEMPFLHTVEGSSPRVYLTGNSLKRYVWTRFRENVSNAALGKRLREMECEPRKVDLTIDGKRTSRGYWALPVGFNH